MISPKPLEDVQEAIKQLIVTEFIPGTNTIQKDSENAEEEAYLKNEPTADDSYDDIEAGGDEDETGERKAYYIEVEDEENDDATVDKPIDEEPFNFLKYPEHEPDHKPHPHFAILKNGFVNYVNLDF
ncbi:uncharacterized protein LOC117893189 [Drosophila subobscura]|uniref:uncharacterized protein LOC117893189 n=1 Tax=Drosophila subobscura TaxID=7241 RepID=UPI00155A6443|nr:uncharacterized protein LOC117893189 [Drosophila subobscura]